MDILLTDYNKVKNLQTYKINCSKLTLPQGGT